MTSDEAYGLGDVVPGGGGGFVLVRRLGAGIFGTVYEAIDSELQRRVAIKILRPELGKAFAERMRREWRTLARLGHDNIVQVLGAGFTTDRGLPYFTMPLLLGATLRQLLSETGALPLDQAIDLGAQLFDALSAAHESDVVHRDVKPENVLVVRPSGRVMRLKLTDFGLVCSASAKHPTAQGLLGTHEYAAPELFYGEAPSPGSDQYSAGIVVFQMLTGIHPLTSARHDWRRLHVESEPLSLAQLLASPPPPLVALLSALLAKDRRERPPSARWCADRLRAIAEARRAELAGPTVEDGIDSRLRRFAPAPDELTQQGDPSPSLLEEAGLMVDTVVGPPPSSRGSR
jgi:serine/threonine-protein kinase